MKTLYHGSNNYFEEFSNAVLSGKDSLDQYGSGFYFYDEVSRTSLHGGIVYTVRADITNPIEWDTQEELSSDVVWGLICAAPDLEGRLAGHGDVEYEGFDEVLERAVACYEGISPLEALNMIGNDFYDAEDIWRLLNKFVKLTGSNCVTCKERNIYVMLRKVDFEITGIRELEEEL